MFLQAAYTDSSQKPMLPKGAYLIDDHPFHGAELFGTHWFTLDRMGNTKHRMIL